MELLYDNKIINEIVSKLFRHRRNDYSEFHLQNAISCHDLRHQLLPVYNKQYEKLHTSLFTKSEKPTVCILFLHGYGSNRLECSNLLPFLKENVAVCCFDFSGSGKSQGDRVTYGVKEKDDIDCTLNYLRKVGFNKFVLWGRSMGATSTLLYSLHYRPEDILLQVLDSPFFSFEMIAFEIASKNVKAPDFLISFALEMSKKNCSKFEANPFDIELSRVGQCAIPALFVYSQEDNVINPQNTHLICSHYKATFEKLIIQENHNTIRTPQTIQKIFNFIEKYLRLSKPKEIHQNNHYHLDTTHKKIQPSSKPVRDSSFVDVASQLRQSRKGIERVQTPTYQANDYGIWVASKIKDHSQSAVRQIKPWKIKGFETPKRSHLSLSSSAANRSIVSSHGFGQSHKEALMKGVEWGKEKSCIQFQKEWKQKVGSLRSLGTKSQLNNSKYL